MGKCLLGKPGDLSLISRIQQRWKERTCSTKMSSDLLKHAMALHTHTHTHTHTFTHTCMHRMLSRAHMWEVEGKGRVYVHINTIIITIIFLKWFFGNPCAVTLKNGRDKAMSILILSHRSQHDAKDLYFRKITFSVGWSVGWRFSGK